MYGLLRIALCQRLSIKISFACLMLLGLFPSHGFALGGPHFRAAQSLHGGNPYNSFQSVVTDLNGDGCPDVAMPHNASYVGGWIWDSVGSIVLFLNEPGCVGHFSVSGSLTTGWPGSAGEDYGPLGLLGLDMDRNGSTDLVGVLQDGAIATFLNNGNGTFQAPVISPSPPEYGFDFWSAEIRVISINSDSSPDLAVLASMAPTAERKLLLFRAKNSPVGGFELDTIYSYPVLLNMASGDLNGDGVINEVALSAVASDGSTYLKVLSIAATGDITPSEFFPINPQSSYRGWITAGDFDGDGRTDIAMTASTEGVIFLNRTPPGGELNFVAHTDKLLTSYYKLSSGDLNGDGRDDVIVNGGYTEYGDAHVLMMGPGGRIAYGLRAPGCDMSQVPPGSGQFCNQANFGTAFTVVDVNNDGRRDIIGTVLEDDFWDQRLTVSLRDGIETGDLNCDNAVNFDDIDPFILALTDAAGYGGQYPSCDIQRADVDGNRSANFNDIDPFIGLLTLLSGSEPSEVSESDPKPIPTINPAQEPKLEVEPTDRTTIKSDGARKKVGICRKAKKKKGGKAKRRCLKTVI